MALSSLDWGIIIAFFVISLLIGLFVAKRSGKSAAEFFLSGRKMPWWLLGVSMVATTFAADTPNLVTDIVRNNGVSGNWVWWAFLLTGMLTVFVYAKLWRRSGILTDLEFYELRYSGRPAAFLRGFRAVYLGVFFNVVVMATVTLAAIKIGGVLLGLTPVQTVLIASTVTVIYSMLGGIRGVILTDFFQFSIAMIGSVWAAVVIVNHPRVGGLKSLLADERVSGSLSLLPDFSDTNVLIPLLIIPLAVQWWSVWYPGAEPGGGGYIAQRMLSAKDEKNAVGATLLFNVAHYALRPWPWILIALASMVVFPMKLSQKSDKTLLVGEQAEEVLAPIGEKEIDFLLGGMEYHLAEAKPEQEADYHKIMSIVRNNSASLEIKAFAHIYYHKNAEKKADKWSDPALDQEVVALFLANPTLELDKLGHDLAYPAMLPFLPTGLLGLVIASLIAAFMSTISTHLNWGSSYLVNDVYQRFVKPDAGDKELVNVGRLSTLVLMILSALLALKMATALDSFNILLQIGAGTGLIFILRWFWWRINAYSELAAMVISFAVALFFEFGYQGDMAGHWQLVTGVAITTAGWLLVTLFTQPDDQATLLKFYNLIKPHSAGWRPVIHRGIHTGELAEKDIAASTLSKEIGSMMAGVFLVYSLLFAVGFWVYGEVGKALIATVMAGLLGLVLRLLWNNK